MRLFVALLLLFACVPDQVEIVRETPCDPTKRGCHLRYAVWPGAPMEDVELVAAGMPVLAQVDVVAQPELELPDLPAMPKWLAWVALIAAFATWLLTSIHALEALIIKAGWWDGRRRGWYLVLYGVIQFAANNLSNFFPSRVGRMTAAAPSSK